MSRKLGNYQILDEIGRGGMAVVYRARQESLDRIVAIKELAMRGSTPELRAADRFRLEARAAASLDHPNIITIYDFWEKSDRAYIAMEYVDGLEIKEILDRQGAMDPVLSAQVGIQICRALSYSHQRGFIHRDVKPGNIMLSAKGQVKLADFGIVLAAGNVDLTTTGQVIGTPSYMSPEQIRGEELGPSTDIFSLGVVLYEMVTGSKPFSAPSDVALTHAILHKRPVKPRLLNPGIGRSLSRTIMRCLRKKARRRFANMDEAARALARSIPRRAQETPVAVASLLASLRSDGPPDATVPLTREIGKRSYSRPLALGFLGLLVILAITLGFPSRPTEVPTDPVRPAVLSQPPETTLAVFAYPWAEIIVDGVSRGYTPRADPLVLAPGRHALVLSNPYFGTRSHDLDLAPGASAFVRVDFLEEGR